MTQEDKIKFKESVDFIQNLLSTSKGNTKLNENDFNIDVESLILDLLYGFNTNIESELLDFIDDDDIEGYATDEFSLISIDDVKGYAEDNYNMIDASDYMDIMNTFEINSLADKMKLENISKMFNEISLFGFIQLEKQFSL